MNGVIYNRMEHVMSVTVVALDKFFRFFCVYLPT